MTQLSSITMKYFLRAGMQLSSPSELDSIRCFKWNAMRSVIAGQTTF